MLPSCFSLFLVGLPLAWILSLRPIAAMKPRLFSLSSLIAAVADTILHTTTYLSLSLYAIMSFVVDTSIRVIRLQHLMTISPYHYDVINTGSLFQIPSPTCNTACERPLSTSSLSISLQSISESEEEEESISEEASEIISPEIITSSSPTKRSRRSLFQAKSRRVMNRLKKLSNAAIGPLPHIQDRDYGKAKKQRKDRPKLRRNRSLSPPPASPRRSNYRSTPKSSFKSEREESTGTTTTVESKETADTTSPIQTKNSSLSERYSFMSYRFPVTKSTEKLVLRKRRRSNNKTIETSDGDFMGSLEHGSPLTGDRDIRILKDATGKPCAIIQLIKDESILYGPSTVFQIYGDKPSHFGQLPSYDKDILKAVNGCYLWAEIRNTGSMGGGTFAMKRYSSKTSFCSADEYTAKRFGSIFKRDFKGFSFFNSKEKECVKMVSLQDNAKGIVIAPKHDTCLMLAFCAVVDEMVENLLM